ncbi:hypothetical protein CYLTODRAFT_491360 [Cylindrobasidium torrendii FP15055 ss-10]|uniref:F-box domain-containing protein n=1 Tax=Cylindrobasidium torrendii FP15055 ss-10 TaxID=1314674 RepID=A0A0D7B7V6_9AGAR|nr:hypothetical protein CYLTODRAFT_491360 [Cylindrobasidium torrendii FP15055 ss-10]
MQSTNDSRRAFEDLPAEIVREIFEIRAWKSSASASKLSLVSKEVRFWMRRIQYHTISLGYLGVRLFARTLRSVDADHSAAIRKYVKYVSILPTSNDYPHDLDDITLIVNTCNAVYGMRVADYHSTMVALQLLDGHLNLKSLAIYALIPAGISCIPASVEVLCVCHIFEPFAAFPTFGRDEFIKLCNQCPNLSTLVVTHLNFMAIVSLDEFTLITPDEIPNFRRVVVTAALESTNYATELFEHWHKYPFFVVVPIHQPSDAQVEEWDLNGALRGLVYMGEGYDDSAGGEVDEPWGIIPNPGRGNGLLERIEEWRASLGPL